MYYKLLSKLTTIFEILNKKMSDSNYIKYTTTHNARLKKKISSFEHLEVRFAFPMSRTPIIFLTELSLIYNVLDRDSFFTKFMRQHKDLRKTS